MKVWINVIKEELVENVWTRTDVALQLVACAVCLKLREYKECYGREAIVVGIDVSQPTISVTLDAIRKF